MNLCNGDGGRGGEFSFGSTLFSETAVGLPEKSRDSAPWVLSSFLTDETHPRLHLFTFTVRLLFRDVSQRLFCFSKIFLLI